MNDLRNVVAMIEMTVGRREDQQVQLRRERKRDSTERTAPAKELPFGARQLSRSDLAAFRPLFAYYLDLQKQLDIDSLDETELRGRWKSFMGKWNRAELAEGWYDPEIFQHAVRDYGDAGNSGRDGMPLPRASSDHPKPSVPRSDPPSTTDQEDNSDDDYGPPPPPPAGHHHPTPSRSTPGPSTSSRPAGPSNPTQTDLALRDEALAAERAAALADLRLARRARRREAQALLEEALPPRADAGTRERRLEKRAALNEALRAFRERSPTGGGGEVDDGTLMGGGDAPPEEEYRALVRAREERRRERISRREEAERARRAEREERVREYREREERVVAGLRELARSRFGVQ
ncbi:223ae199-8235-4030-99b8-ef25b13b8040 [Thermothielavioides terrestris]|uniref:223ae199-8235-4030-99b8-ef25b13b8040 n=1 Tax=Thermothielavioides terrestris TaxID=2587410 RepID=A0A446BWG7_9PEZI|nr:223ae199-8235-4030-99b8-ef25b13b8040 [Thermothielavioides terrestris]